MSLTSSLVPKSGGLNLDLDNQAFGFLKSAAEIARDPEVLRLRLLEEGYLYLPGFLDRAEVLRARESITERLAAEGLSHPDYPAFEGVAKPGARTAFRPDLAFGNREPDLRLKSDRLLRRSAGRDHTSLRFHLVQTAWSWQRHSSAL